MVAKAAAALVDGNTIAGEGSASSASAIPVPTKAKEVTPDNRSINTLLSIISGEIGAIALTKQEGVPFPMRGIDTVVNIIAPILRKYGVIVVPSVESVEVIPREVGNRVVKTAVVTTEFTFIAPNGSAIKAKTAGLADDFSDRSVAQAQSVAFRVALLQTFTLPTQSIDPEVASQKAEDETVAAIANAVKAPSGPVAETVESIRAKIGAVINDANSPYDGSSVNALGDKLFAPKTRDEWGGNLPSLKKLHAALLAGEVA